MILRLLFSKLLPRTCIILSTSCSQSSTATNISKMYYFTQKLSFKTFLTRNISIYKLSNKAKNNSVLDESKSKLILLMNFESAEDALPFYKLPTKTLLRVYKTTKNDVKNGHCKNRLYYLSQRIKCPPSVLSERLAKRSFVYSLSFEWLENSLNVILEMGISSDRILRDLWVLKYHHETIRERLQRVSDAGVENLYPWMVRCSEDILIKYIKYCQDSKTILGDMKSTSLYLANRLNISSKELEMLSFRLPALNFIRVTKVKKFMDFLEKEGYTPEEIAKKPRILTTSQNTVKERIERLKKLGLCHISLNILCRSRKDFKKYCESMELVKHPCKKS